jgi:DNA-binding Lrp family transcriptional regulator
MDDLDRKILEMLQYEFPLEERPYDVLAGKLSISSEELWRRVKSLVERGVIRRIGASLDSHKLGYSSTLAAVKVAAERVEDASEAIGRYLEVTHSYLRKDEFNIWFTVIARDEAEVVRILGGIRKELSLGADEMLNLPMKRLFKLDARFRPDSVAD